ncbi:hypothetical protein [Streptomyces phaeochromogenes]
MTPGSAATDSAARGVRMEASLLSRFLAETQRACPAKQFGYFLATRPGGDPEEYILMGDNVRDSWADDFRSYGRYFEEHDDAGFVCSPQETYRVQRYIRDHGLHTVGVFHSHRRHPALLTSVDADLHPSADLWHLIVMLRNPLYPQVRAFRLESGEYVREIAVTTHAGEPR